MSWDTYHDCPARKGKCPECGSPMSAMADELLDCHCGWYEGKEDEPDCNECIHNDEENECTLGLKPDNCDEFEEG